MHGMWLDSERIVSKPYIGSEASWYGQCPGCPHLPTGRL